MRRLPAPALVAVGALLAANQLYLDALLPYPTAGDGWRMTGVYVAELGMVGWLAVLVGVERFRDAPTTVRRAAGIAFGAVVAHVALNRSLLHASRALLGRDAYEGTLVVPLSYPGTEGLFIEFALATLFFLVAATRVGRLRDHPDVVAGFVAVFLALTFLPVLRGGSPTGPLAAVGGILFAAVSSDLAGVPLLSAFVVLAVPALGVLYARPAPKPV